MTKLSDLLHDPTPPERAIADAIERPVAIPIREAMDPARTPLDVLPFLAAHNSVDLWFDDWSEARKRRMVAEAKRLAFLKGSRAAAGAFLDYVDTEIVFKRSYPARAPVGRIAAGRTPINHPTFTARFLLKVALTTHRSAVLVGRTAVGRAAVKTIDREPIRRARRALVASKAPETAYSDNFAHRARIMLDETFDLDAGHDLGSFKDRKRL